MPARWVCCAGLGRDLAIVENYGIMALRSGKKWSEYDTDTIRGTDRPLDVIDAIRKVNAISMTSSRPPVIRPRLGSDHVSGTMVLRAHEVTIGYPGNKLFTIHNLELRRGECAALIGPNGSGKTTLLKTLLGQVEPLKGHAQPGRQSENWLFCPGARRPERRPVGARPTAGAQRDGR